MGAKVSAETKRAVKLFQAGGISVAAAAAKCGILPTTLYRALERDKAEKAKCNTL